MTTAVPSVASNAPGSLAAGEGGRRLTEPCILFLIVLALVTFGVLLVYSASRTADAADTTHYFPRQAYFALAGFGTFVLGALIRYRRLNRWWVAMGVLGLTVALLVLVLFIGSGRGTARRFLSLPLGLHFQPSELAKFAVVLFLAWFYSRPAVRPRRFARSFVPAIAVIGLVCALVVKEDFGTAALVGAVAVSLCMIAGWRWWYPALLLVPAAVGAYVTVWLVPYRLDRLKVWLDPWAYFSGAGWHVCQSLMALGSGGLTGVGLGAGIQKLYIPDNTTDFIFAVLCEEMGILGGVMLIGLFGVFVWRAGKVVRTAPDRFGFLLASGILLVVGLQAIMNIGVVTSALPAKGIGLPFISYGGSSLVMMCFAAGLLASIARQRDAEPARSVPLVRLPARRG